MDFFNCNFHSDILGTACFMNVIIPQQSSTQIGMGSSGGRKTYPGCSEMAAAAKINSGNNGN